jgi:glycine/D-amino acid oxidase-like deaminating enzyme
MRVVAYDVMIVGGGPLGVSVALLLARIGLRVLIVEAGPALLSGASGRAHVIHIDGLEYWHGDHVATGYGCVEGAFVKGCRATVKLTPPRQ